MKPSLACRFSSLAAAVAILASCSGARTPVLLVSPAGKNVALGALSPEAETGVIAGGNGTAWFSFKPEKAGIPASAPERQGRGALEISLVNEGNPPARVSVAFVTSADLSARGGLVSSPAPRNLSTVSSASGALHIRMVFPDAGKESKVRGFAVSASGGADSRVRIVSATVTDAQTGWERQSSSFWAGFPAEGGSIDVKQARSKPVHVPDDSVLSVIFDASGDRAGTPLVQNRSVFTSGSRHFGFRATPGPSRSYLPSVLVSPTPADISADPADASLAGLRVRSLCPFVTTANIVPSGASPKAGKDAPAVPILADPNMIIEWPRAAWRRESYEVFAWDRFPSVIIFDTADYAVQDRFFKRLAFFVEKDGYRGRLVPDSELASLHAYNAHDYRAESLAAFFEAARSSNFPLDAEEAELCGILSAEGVIRKEGKSWVPGAGAVLSFSRESVGYLRYLFMAHEGYHGIYFVDADYRAEVSRVYRAMDPRAIKFLQGYFTVVASLGYDTHDEYLMENEFMAYLMQQPEDRVATYFTENILDRYVKHGGSPALARYIKETNAADFSRAAGELGGYAFKRWGIAGGRIGLYFFD